MSLFCLIYETWGNISFDSVISNVFSELKRITGLINKVNGGNDLIEQERGKQHSNMKFDFVNNTIKLE